MLNAAKDFAKKILQNDHSGHDLDHTLRVCRTAEYIARQEGADPELAQLAAPSTIFTKNCCFWRE